MSKRKRPVSRPKAGNPQKERTADPARRRRLGRGATAGVVVAIIVVVVIAIAFRGVGTLRRRSTPAVRKTADQNVLLITLDTLRADALRCYGGKAATPNLDRLASLGTRYDFAHAHAVMTLVSHASILTGLYPTQHGIHDNYGFHLSPDTPTLATILRARGVPTAAFIASFALDSRFGLNNGFGVYDESYGKSRMVSGFNMPERRGDAVVDVATRWIAGQHGRWFAWTHLFDPHAPYDPPSPYREQYAQQPYYGEVAFMDSTLGRLFDAARDPSGRPTLVVVTGDHGEGLGEHGEMTHGLFAYEATLRVPLIVAQIDRSTPAWSSAGAPAAAGTVSNVPVQHVDIVPTILDALGLQIPSGLPGHSLLEAERAAGDRPSYFEAMSASFNRGWAPLTGVLAGSQKYIDLPLPERYDLASDWNEQRNLVGEGPETNRRLRARLDAFRVAAASSNRREDADAQARLRALGYVTGSAAAKGHYTEDDDPKRLVDLDQLLRKAVDLYEEKRPSEAIPVYQEVIARRPGMEVSYSQLAMLYWELGDPRSAIATLERARQAGLDSVAVRTKLGMYLAETGNVNQAVPILQEATAGASPDLDALNALGIALVRSGRVAEGETTFNRILQMNASNSMALENLGAVALQHGQVPQARSFLERALEIDPGSPQAHNSLGVMEMKAGNRKAAIEHWKAAFAADQSNLDALYNIGTALFDDGQKAAALPYLERFVRTAPAAFYGRDIEYVKRLLAR